MPIFEDQKERLTRNLSEQYAQNVIDISEYEKLLDSMNKAKSLTELSIIENTIAVKETMTVSETAERHLSVFSWQTSRLKSVNGSGGKYSSIFGANRIIVDSLPQGRTILELDAVFGLIELIVPKSIKINNNIKTIFSGVFSSPSINNDPAELPELYLVGKAVFANVTIISGGTIQAK